MWFNRSGRGPTCLHSERMQHVTKQMFLCEITWKTTDVSLICWVNLRAFLVTWSALVYTASKQVRRALLGAARLARHEAKAIHTALAFTGLIQWTNSQLHVMWSPGWNHSPSVHDDVYVNSWTPQVLFLFFFCHLYWAHSFFPPYYGLKYLLKNESPCRDLVWKMDNLLN